MKLSKLRASTSTRQLAGATIPRQNTTSFGMRAALKKGGSGYAGESGDVGGNPAKMHLARARRHGGMVKRTEGGRIPEWKPKDRHVPFGERPDNVPPAIDAADAAAAASPVWLSQLAGGRAAQAAARLGARLTLPSKDAEDRAKGGSVKKKGKC